MNRVTFLCIAICGFMLITCSAAAPSCDKVQPDRKDECRSLVRRWFELKDQYYIKCCEESPVNECPDCEASAKREATAKIMAEKKANQVASRMGSVDNSNKDDDSDVIAPATVEDRVALGIGRYNVFRPRRH